MNETATSNAAAAPVVQPNPFLRALRAVAQWPLVQRLTQLELVARVGRSARAVLLKEKLRFIASELAPGQRTQGYTLRSGRARVNLRHHGMDILILDEVFAQRHYDVPPQLQDKLPGGDSPRIVDLGGNVGLFGSWVLERYPNAQITSFEPDPGNANVLKGCIAENDAAGHWQLVEACATASSRRLSFSGGQGAVSQIAGPREAGSLEVDAVDVFPSLEQVDWLKMDIEGGEWELLQDPRFASVPASLLVLEYHAHLCPGPDPLVEVRRLLEQAGYEIGQEFLERDESGTGMLWAWRNSQADRLT